MQYVSPSLIVFRSLDTVGHDTDLPRVKNDTDLGNVPMVFGEWGITTNFEAVRPS